MAMIDVHPLVKAKLDLIKEEYGSKSYSDTINILLLNHQAETDVMIVDLPDKVIKEIIIDYTTKNKGKKVYPSDIAFKYNLDARKVFDLCQGLTNNRKKGECDE